MLRKSLIQPLAWIASVHPEEGWIKANDDGSFESLDSSGGGGVVWRNHHGRFYGGMGPFFSSVTLSKQAFVSLYI